MTTVLTREAEPDPTTAFAAALAARSGGLRALYTPRDAAWSELDPPAGSAPVRWIAFEPLDETRGLAALGHEVATMEDALALLPRIARAFGALLTAQDAGAAMRDQVHMVKNLLAGTLANVEYASFELAQLDPAGEAARSLPGDLTIALRNAVDGTRKIVLHLHELQRLGMLPATTLARGPA